MIRKAVLVVSSVGLVATAGLPVLRFISTPPWTIADTQRVLITVSLSEGSLIVGGAQIDLQAPSFVQYVRQQNPSASGDDIRTAREQELARWLTREAPESGTAGFAYLRTRLKWCIALPLWLPITMFAAYPAIVFVGGLLRRHRRRNKGLCLKCGYNLRALVDPVCPECGQAFDPARRREALLRLEPWSQRAVRWRARYSASTLRKTTTVLLLSGVAGSLAMWGTSYFRVSYDAAAFTCRAAWGNLIFYGNSADETEPTPRQFRVAGFHDFSTMWWPYPFVRGRGTALYIPLWIPTLLFALLWGLSYRPVYRLRWHQRTDGHSVGHEHTREPAGSGSAAQETGEPT